MSISKSVGRCTLFALVVYLFVKGALIVVPRNMVAAVSALVAALVHACCGSVATFSMQAEESSVAVVAKAFAPIHGLERSATVGECGGRPEDHQGAVNVPSQDQSFE